MSYLAMFLSQHARANCSLSSRRPEVPKVPEGPFGTFGTDSCAQIQSRAAQPWSDDHGLAIRDVLGFPAQLLGGLPVPIVLVLDVPNLARWVTVATHARSAPAMFGPNEWQALILGAETGRISQSVVCVWFQRKLRAPQCSQAAFDPGARGQELWTVDMVLQRLGIRLRAVVVEGGMPNKTRS